MCQMLSPERAVIWAILHDGECIPDVAGALRPDYFTHPPYRRWFEAALQWDGAFDAEGFLRHLQANGEQVSHADKRALRRMFRIAPPSRVRANLSLMVGALADRHAGHRVHLEKLIN